MSQWLFYHPYIYAIGVLTVTLIMLSLVFYASTRKTEREQTRAEGQLAWANFIILVGISLFLAIASSQLFN